MFHFCLVPGIDFAERTSPQFDFPHFFDQLTPVVEGATVWVDHDRENVGGDVNNNDTLPDRRRPRFDSENDRVVAVIPDNGPWTVVWAEPHSPEPVDLNLW